jgi:hypothetical protein
VNRCALGLAFACVLATSAESVARGDDGNAGGRPAADTAALDELKQGYALKQANDCPHAIAHLQESLRLSPTPKAMLNLADCELRTGALASAKEHVTAGRALAVLRNDAELIAVADAQSAAIEQRMAWLTLRLSASAPAGTQVKLDRETVPLATLGIPAAINPGAHTIETSAPGRTLRQVAVTIGEGEHREIAVDLGPTSALVAAPARGGAASGPPIPFYTALGIGVVGLAVGIGTGVAGQSKHAALEGECGAGGVCPASARGDLDDFHTLKTVSTVAYAAGGAGLVGAALLWFLLPHRGAAMALRIGPGSATLSGTF